MSKESIKYRAEVTGINEDTWSSNGIEYDTQKEAETWLKNLSDRWFGYDLSRVVTTETPKRQTVDLETQTIFQNFRK